MTFKEHYQQLNEAIAIGKTWYHGTTHNFEKFDYPFVMTENSNAQYGPGFYLTDNIGVARGYANGRGFVKHVNLTRRGRILDEKFKGGRDRFDFMITSYLKAMPDRESVLENWDENPFRAENALRQSLQDSNETMLELVQSIWADCYRDHEEQFVRRLVRKSLIDGFHIKVSNDINFLVAYNPDILKITKTEIVHS